MRSARALAPALALAAACAGGAGPSAPAAAREPKAGDVTTDPGGWVEYTVGDAPLVISAPHGGSLSPSFLPTRSCAGCLTGGDEGIEDLARRVAAKFQARTGMRAHVVIARISRAKLDANRDVVEGTGGNAATVPIWEAYHAFLDSAGARVARAHRRGLLLDLHGTAHPLPRLELGYLTSAAELRLADDALGASGAVARSSIARLASDNRGHASAVALLRGPTSLGAILARNGYPAVPSPGQPAPAVGEEYYDGGYITDRHGSSRGGSVDAIQIEAWKTGVRDTPANLDRYAAAIVATAIEYLDVHYGWTSPSPVLLR